MEPCGPETPKKGKKTRVLKTVSLQACVDKYSKYGLYEYNGSLHRIAEKWDKERAWCCLATQQRSVPHLPATRPGCRYLG